MTPIPPKLNAITSKTSRSAIVLAIKVVLAGATILFIVRAISLDVLLDTAARADLPWIAAACALLPLNLALESAIWLPLLRLVTPEVSWTASTRAVVGGYPLGFITPGRIGEFVGRAVTLSENKRTEIGVSVAAARLPELGVLLAVGTLVLGRTMLGTGPDYPGRSLFLAVVVVATIVVWTVMLFPRKTTSLLRRVAPRSRLHGKLAFLNRVDRAVGVRVVSRSVLRLSVFCTQFVLLVRAFDSHSHPLSRTYEAVLTTFTAKSIIPPVTFLDLGIREGVAAYFFHTFGMGASVGFDAAFVLFLINVLLPALVGLPLISRYRIGSNRRTVERDGS